MELLAWTNGKQEVRFSTNEKHVLEVPFSNIGLNLD